MLGPAAILPVMLVLSGLCVMAAIEQPSALMALMAAIYVSFRHLGVGQGLGASELGRIDRGVLVTMVLSQGAYAWLCAGVTWSGAFCSALLTGGHLTLQARQTSHWWRWAPVAFLWAMILLRLLHPSRLRWPYYWPLMNFAG